MTDFNNFVGAAKRIDDIDIPRIGHRIGVGEDEIHAFMDCETSGSGFDKHRRPKMLFEPHRFYANLKGSKAKRDEAVAAGLAYAKWKPGAYPADSYPRLIKAMAIDETAALKSASWGLGQVMGENFKMAGYDSPQAMVLAAMADEENHLDAMVNFMIAAKIDGHMRKLAALDRPTTAADCVPIVKIYNGPGYAKNGYHTKFAKAHNKWRKIKDTPWSPSDELAKANKAPSVETTPMPTNTSKPSVFRTIWGTIVGRDIPIEATEKKRVGLKEGGNPLLYDQQEMLSNKGYTEVGQPDGLNGRRTRDAVSNFRKENGLAAGTHIDEAFSAALISAKPRRIAVERAEATAKDLREKGSPQISLFDRIGNFGKAILALAGIGGAKKGAEVSGGLETVQSTLESAQGSFETLSLVLTSFGGVLSWCLSNWWIFVLIGGLYLVYQAKNGVREYTLLYRLGFLTRADK